VTPATVPAVTRGGLGGRAAALAPSRDELVDGVALLTLTLIGIAGFRVAYGGHGYLIAGAAGAVLGVVLSHVGQRARLPLLAVAAVGVLAFLLFGGVASQSGAVSLQTLQAVVGAAIRGWQQLLTTARPVGSSADLLVLPYLLGLFSGVAGHALARRTRAVLLPAVAPAVVVVLSILFGGSQPVAAVLQGAGFTGVALGWAAARQQRGAQRITTVGRQRPWQRIGAAVAVLAIAGAGAVFLGPRLPGADAHQRVVLDAVPPFDVNVYPSPLAGYRDYTQVVPPTVSVYGKELFATTGLPAGSRVRIAAMDTYDGLAWGVANAAASGSTFAGFQRVGGVLPGAASGPARTATITIEGAYTQPWLPDLAGTTGFAFTGAAGSTVASALRFNVATTTGIVPGGLPAGLRYTVRAADPVTPTAAQLANASPYGAPAPSITIPPAIQAFADAHAATANSPMAKVLALAAYLKDNGRYSNGGGAQSEVTAGHGAGRLTTFLQGKQIIGDDEQYAAAMALLANAVGVPARVSLDGTVQADGAVYGRDVRADVELDLVPYGWVTLPASQFTGTRQPTLQQQIVTPQPQPAKVVPPRQNSTAPSALGDDSSAVSHGSPGATGSGFRIPAIVLVLLRYVGLPLVLLAAAAAALTGAKTLRRRRRRGTGPPAARVAGAWRELLDLGRDLGIAPAAHGTRREQAAAAQRSGFPQAVAVAVAADAAVFGPADPDAAAVARVWSLVDEARQQVTSRLSRGRRAWVRVNPASLWASRAAAARVMDAVRGRFPAGGPHGGGRRGVHGALRGASQ
jgi:hypothetical protein